jgi:phospholipid/cholesterol/gamma-HCH transport system permease protein
MRPDWYRRWRLGGEWARHLTAAIITQVEGSLTLTHLFIGLIKALVFALLIGIAGTRAGMVADRNSEGVGRATTEAVVTALVYLIVADAAANIICQLADI